MKFKILLFFLIASTPFFSQKGVDINDLLITYQLDYKNDSTASGYTNHDNYYLNISENAEKSIFISVNKKKSDSLAKIGGIYALFELKKIKLDSSYKIFYNSKSRDLFTIDDVGSNQFYYVSKNYRITWKITDERKKILNYNCIKATSEIFGRKWTAWFISDLPIPEGPYKFKDLPGLIAEIYDDHFNYKFSILEIKKSNEVLTGYIDPIKNAKEITVKEFNKMKKEMYENPYITIPNYDLLEDRMKERLKSVMEIRKKEIGNNPIELINQ